MGNTPTEILEANIAEEDQLRRDGYVTRVEGIICVTCGAIVHRDYVKTHRAWHGTLMVHDPERD